MQKTKTKKHFSLKALLANIQVLKILIKKKKSDKRAAWKHQLLA